LQVLQHNRQDCQCCPDHERPRPSETEKAREYEIADEVIELKAKSRAWCPFRGSQGENHEDDQSGHAANLQRQSERHTGGPSLKRIEFAVYVGTARRKKVVNTSFLLLLASVAFA
jgi:hypothetical protein